MYNDSEEVIFSYDYTKCQKITNAISKNKFNKLLQSPLFY